MPSLTPPPANDNGATLSLAYVQCCSRAALRSLGLSSYRLGRELGVTRRTAQRWLSGESPVDRDVVLASPLGSAFHREFRRLLGVEDAA
jgi:transcriptional regulator with XRE-family HTH domain